MIDKVLCCCNKIIESGIIFLVIFTPLAFGTVHPWAYSLMELTLLFLLLVWLTKLLLLLRKSGQLRWKKSPLNIPFVLFLILVMFQLAPLPPVVMRDLSPGTYRLYKEVVPTWYSNKDVTPAKKDWRSLSVCPHETKLAYYKLLGYVLIFLLIINNIETRSQVKRVTMAIILTGSAVGFLAILQLMGGGNKIYWFWQSVYIKRGYRGPFVNHNHFAGYMEMVIPLAIGMFISGFLTPLSAVVSTNWRHRLSVLESRLSKSILLLFLISLSLCAHLLSLSRGGTISLLLAMTFLFIALGIKQSFKKKRKGILVIVGFALIILIWLGIDPVLSRLATLLNIEQQHIARPTVWKDTVHLIENFPIFGVGLGNFKYTFPIYKTLHYQIIWEDAHNDYLQFMADTGVIGFLIFFGGFLIFLWKSIKIWHKRRDPFVSGLTIGGVSSIVALLIHSGVDFNLHIPSNALLFSIILGLVWVTVNIKSKSGKDYSLATYRTITTSCNDHRKTFIYYISMGVMVASLLVSFSVIKMFLGERAFQHYTISHSPDYLESAIHLDPSNAKYHYLLGDFYSKKMEANWYNNYIKQAESYGEKAFESYLEAVTLSPTKGWYHLGLAWVARTLPILSSKPLPLRVSPEYQLKIASMLDPTNIYIKRYEKNW